MSCWYSQVISIPPHPLLYAMSTGSGDDVDTLLAILYYMIRVEGSMWRICAGAYALDNHDRRTYDDVELLKELSYWSILTPMELFQHVRSTSYLLKAFGILYVMLIQPGHKYSNPPPTLCHVTCHSLCVSHWGTNPTGRWWFQPPMELFQHVRSTSYLLKAFGILYMLI